MTADILAFTSRHTTKLKAQSGVKPLYTYAFRPDARMAEQPQDPLLVQKQEAESSKSRSTSSPTSNSFVSFLRSSRRKYSLSSSTRKNRASLPSPTITTAAKTTSERKYNSIVTLMSTYPSAVAISENLRRDDVLSLFTALRPHLLLSLRGKPQFDRWLTTLVRYTRECETCEITAKESRAIENQREYRLNGWYRGTHTCVGCGDIICTSCATFFAHASDWRNRIAQTLGYSTVIDMIRTDSSNGERYIPAKEYTDRQKCASAEDMFTYVRSFCKGCAKDPCAFKVGFGHEVRPNLIVKDLLKGRPSHIADDERRRGVNGEGEGEEDEIRSIHSSSSGERGGKRELDHRTVMIEECNVIPYGFFRMSTTPCWMMQPGGTLIDAFSWGHGRVVIRSRHHDN